MRFLKYALTTIVATAALLPGMAGAATTAPGDLNGDGKVTILDAQMALQMAVGASSDASKVTAADLAPIKADGSFGDGKVTVADAIAILRLAVGLDVVANYTPAKEGAAGGDGPTSPPIILPAVQFNVSTPRGRYGTTDPIPFTVSVKNNTDKELKWNFRDSCQVDLQVANEKGEVAWHPTAMCLDVLTSLDLKPGEEKDWNYTWEGNPKLNQLPRQPGGYTASASLVGTEYGSSITFQVSDIIDPLPPYTGPVTFDFTPGRADHYANLTRGGDEEVIRYLQYVKAGGQAYAQLSRTPDGASNALLRLDSDNNVWQRTGDSESIRLKLNAKEGETWDFDEEGSVAHATLTSRSATLKTPVGLYTNLLQFDFFVGPDNSWTEWVNPQGYWVGYTRETIAGPIDYRLTNRDFTGFPVSSDNSYAAILTPGFVAVNPGDTVQFGLIVVNPDGTPSKDVPGTISWHADTQIGAVDQNGLFTATMDKMLTKGRVWAEIQLADNKSLTAEAIVQIGGVTDGGTGSTGGGVIPVPPKQSRIWFDSDYVQLLPGATFQYVVHLLDPNGQEAKPVSVKWTAEPAIGTIDANGLFTAASVATGVWGAVSAEVQTGYGDEVLTLWSKVYVGPDANTPPTTDPVPPVSEYRLDIEPRYAYPKSGEQVQFKATLIAPPDKAGAYTLKWSLKPEEADLGTITADGLFTAGKDGAAGPVYVQAVDANGNVLVDDYAKVQVGGTPTPPDDPGTVTPAYQLEIEPRYSYPKPGEQVQFNAKLIAADGNAVAYKLNWYVTEDEKIGTITPEGLFTAGTTTDAQGPVYVQVITPDGKVILEDYAKVWVGGSPVPPPPTTDPGPEPLPPVTTSRLLYLDGGTLKLSIPETFAAEPGIQADITGYMPDPSWSFDHTDVKVDGTTIYLYPTLIQKDPGAIVPAHTVPQTVTQVVLKLTANTTYTVIAVGQDSKLVGQIKI